MDLRIGERSSQVPSAPAKPRRLAGTQDRLTRLTRLSRQGTGRDTPSRGEEVSQPAWRRPTPSEAPWWAILSVIAAIVLQARLRPDLTEPLPHFLLPALEGALLIGLGIAHLPWIELPGKVVRAARIVLILLITAANAASAVLLMRAIVRGEAQSAAGPLLATGASVWATNVIAFALWY
jgi:hypothetical protein